MSWSLVQQSAAQATGGTYTLPANSTAGNLLILIATNGSGTALTPPANWTTVASIANSTTSETFIFAYFNTVGGQSSFAVTGGSGAIQAEVLEFTCPGVAQVAAASATGTNTAGAVTAITVTGSAGTKAGDLCIIAALQHVTSAAVITWTDPSGYGETSGLLTASSNNHGYGAFSTLPGGAASGGAQSVTVTSSLTGSSTGWTGVFASFSQPAGGAPLTMQRRVRYPDLRRRGRAVRVVPAQVNPPYPFAEIRQWRQPRGFFPRRGRTVTPVPAQLNPPFPFSPLRQWRQLRGLLPRRGREAQPPWPQAAAVQAPGFVNQALRHVRLAATLRRGRAQPPVPPQDAPVQASARRARPQAPLRRTRPRPLPGGQDTPPASPVRHARPSPLPRQHQLRPLPAAQDIPAASRRGRLAGFLRRRWRDLLPPAPPPAPPPVSTPGCVAVTDKNASPVTLANAAAGAVTVADAPAGTVKLVQAAPAAALTNTPAGTVKLRNQACPTPT